MEQDMSVAIAFHSPRRAMPDTLSPEVQRLRDNIFNIEMSLQSLHQQEAESCSRDQHLRAQETRELHQRRDLANADLAKAIENEKTHPYIAEHPLEARLLVDQKQPPFDKEESRISNTIREKVQDWAVEWPSVRPAELDILTLEHRDGHGKPYWTAVVAHPLVMNPEYATFRAGLRAERATRTKALAALRDDLNVVPWEEPL